MVRKNRSDLTKGWWRVMNTQQRRKAMRFIIGLVLFGALLFWWTPLQTTGLLIIMFCGGFVLREMMEPIRKEGGE